MLQKAGGGGGMSPQIGYISKHTVIYGMSIP
jgi:hypothetical protein